MNAQGALSPHSALALAFRALSSAGGSSPSQHHSSTCYGQPRAPAPARCSLNPCSGSSPATHQGAKVTQAGLPSGRSYLHLLFQAVLPALLDRRGQTFLLWISHPPFHPHLVPITCLDPGPCLYPHSLSVATSLQFPALLQRGVGALGGCGLRTLDAPGWGGAGNCGPVSSWRQIL